MYAFLQLEAYIQTYIKQLLDEIEHDIMNDQNRGLCYLPKPKAEADNTVTNSKIVLLYIYTYNSSSETEAKHWAILFLRTLQGA